MESQASTQRQSKNNDYSYFCFMNIQDTTGTVDELNYWFLFGI